MKILLLSFYYKPDLCAGSFRMTGLVEQLKKIPGIEIEIITTIPNRYASFQSEALAFEQDGNVSVHRISLPSHKSGMVDQIRAFSTYFKHAIRLTKNKNYDLVFGTSSRLFTAFLASWIAKSKRVPLYLDIRDIFVDTIEDVLSSKIALLIKPFLRIVEAYSFANANHINLVSEGFEEYFKSRYAKPSYSFFTNGIDAEFLKASDNITENESTDAESVNILYAGNIGEGQGLHSIIPDLAKLAGSKFYFNVIGDGGRKVQLQKACDGIANIRLEPPISREELLERYKTADILFLHLNDYPAFKKVLPSKLFEYGAMGKPILAGVDGYASKFIRENLSNAEVFSPTNAEQGLESLLSLDLKDNRRNGFIAKFARKNIMAEMADSIIKSGGTT